MSDSGDNVVSLIDREEAIFKARLSGKSVRRIAHEFHIEIAQVEDIIQRNCPVINIQMRAIALALDLERLDELQETFYSDAVKGDVQAAAILLKIAERRSAYLGIDAPVRVDPVQLLAAAKPRPTSTDLIEAAIRRIAAEHKPKDAAPDSEPSPPAE
jgi:hypothetical protein